MTSQAVMKRYLTSVAKNNEEYKDNKTIQSIVYFISIYKKLDAEEKEVLDAKIESAYNKLQAKGVSASKSTSKATTTRRTKSSSDGGLKGILADLKKKLGAEKFRDATRGTDIKKDIQIPALKKGKRIVRKKGKTSNQYGTFKNKVGRAYWESRANRYDANQPSQTRKYKLADGGEMEEKGNLNRWSNSGMDEIIKRREVITEQVRFAFAKVLGLDRAYALLLNDNVGVSPYTLVERAVSSDLLLIDEIDKNLINSAIGESEDSRRYSESGEGIGSSDMTYMLKYMLDGAGLKTDFVKNTLQRVDNNGNVIQLKNKLPKTTMFAEGGETLTLTKAWLVDEEDGLPKIITYSSLAKAKKEQFSEWADSPRMRNLFTSIKDLDKYLIANYGEEGMAEKYKYVRDDSYRRHMDTRKRLRNDEDTYPKGTEFGQGGKVSNIDDEIATQELKEEVKSKMKKGDAVIHFAFTDYGGDFIDKVAIEYFEENYPKNIVVENTAYFGKNAFVFGKPAEEWIEASEDYILGFEDFESFYYEKTNEAEQEGFEDYLGDLERDGYEFDMGEVLSWLMENKGGYYNVTTQGLDFSYGDITDELLEEGLIRKEEYAKGGKLSSKAKYIPKRDIAEIEVEKNGKSKSIDGANLLDGVYVKKGAKFAKGGKVAQKVFVAKEDGILGIFSGSDAYSIEISKGDTFVTYGKQDNSNWWYVKKVDKKPSTMSENNDWDYTKSKSRVNVNWDEMILTFPKGDNMIYAQMVEKFAKGGTTKRIKRKGC